MTIKIRVIFCQNKSLTCRRTNITVAGNTARRKAEYRKSVKIYSVVVIPVRKSDLAAACPAYSTAQFYKNAKIFQYY